MEKIENVIIINDFNYIQGGASKVAIDTAKLLKQAGKKVYFFSADNQEEQNLEGITYISTNQKEALKDSNRLRGMVNGIYNFKAKKELKNLLEKLEADKTIIHIHGWTKVLSSSIFDICFKMKFKVVLTLHDYFTACPNGGYYNYKDNEICKLNPLSWKCIKCNCDSRNYLIKLYRLLRQFVQNWIIKRTKENVIYISNFSKEKLENSYISSWKSKLISNPINFEKEQFKNTFENEKYIFVGRIAKEKGIEMFCNAITSTNNKAIVVGDGPEKVKMQNKYQNIEFVGWQETENIKKYLIKSRALIFTSLWYETMGLTAIEALALGIPVIVGDNCATREYIQDKKNGLIYKMGNTKDLILKLRSCDNQCIKQMSKNAYEIYWKSPFSKEKYIEKILNYYNEILA